MGSLCSSHVGVLRFVWPLLRDGRVVVGRRQTFLPLRARRQVKPPSGLGAPIGLLRIYGKQAEAMNFILGIYSSPRVYVFIRSTLSCVEGAFETVVGIHLLERLRYKTCGWSCRPCGTRLAVDHVAGTVEGITGIRGDAHVGYQRYFRGYTRSLKDPPNIHLVFYNTIVLKEYFFLAISTIHDGTLNSQFAFVLWPKV